MFGEHPMALNVFLLLSCIGLVFLIYAMANFWNEWRRYRNSGSSVAQFDDKNWDSRLAVIPSVFLHPRDRNPVIPFPARYRKISLSLEHQTGFARTMEIRRRVVSELRASQGRK